MSTGGTTDATAAGSVISLPKGGGAVSGLGEKFAPDLFTGTGNFSVPISVPPGRLGLAPALGLAYSSGSGAGPFGLGWALTLPGVTRKTSHGVPRYADDAGPDGRPADVFVLSGAEDLVPVDGAAPGRVRYRPRTEGLFARIEHVRDGSGDYWEVRTRDGNLTRYGTARPAAAPADWRDPAVVADPDDPRRVFGWRITETRDPLGNLIRYSYVRDRGAGPGHHWDQPLLSRISYADYGDRADPSFLVGIEFEYEPRPDPVSDRRAGFELRTTLRCTTIRVVTHAADGVARVSREHRLSYAQAAFSGVSLLTRVEVVGIDAGAVPPGAEPATEALPPLVFGYSDFDPAGRRFAPLTGPGLPPRPLSDPALSLVDLRGGGLPDIVEMGASPRYWRNIGGGRFALPRPMHEAPALAAGGAQFLDADGDGRADLLVSAAATGGAAGFFPMEFGGGWSRRSFQPYRQAPAIGPADPSTRLVDLDGDGLTDLLHSGARLEAFFNDPDRRRAWQRTAPATGSAPEVDLADPRIRLADMTGDGLADIVLLANGAVSYWPNLGHNRWGERVGMHRSPRLPAGFDPRRVLLGDLDGDGAADLAYVDAGRVLLWGNQGGDGWTERPVTVTGTPAVVDTDAVQIADLNGTGMAGILFSRAADGTGRPHLWFLDVTGGVKPHLLTTVDNRLGALTRVHYRPSTVDYLGDAADPAARWRTTLPFPVQVVARVEVVDAISGGRLTTEYRYHHGYWDGVEREFRGFAMVEHLDTETFDAAPASGPGSVPDGHFSPPTLMRTWFHPGPVAAVAAGDWTELDLRDEYWPGDAPMLSRPPELTAFLGGLSRRDRRSALRAMRGHPVRTELYAVDGTDRADRPYTVTESLPGVREESPPTGPDTGRERVFFPLSLGGRTSQWERGDDPMTRLTVPAGYDAYGMPTGEVTVGVPRGRDPRVADPAATAPYLATYTTSEHARRDDADHYLVDRVARTSTAEIVNDGRSAAADLVAAVLAGAPAGIGFSVELVSHVRTYYDGAEFAGLPLSVLGEHGLPVRTESLAFTDAFLDGLFDPADPAAVTPRPVYLDPAGVAAWPPEYPAAFRDAIPAVAGYRHRSAAAEPGSPAGYYVLDVRHRYDVHDPTRPGRGLLLASLDPVGAVTEVDYDAHDLLPVRSTDAAGLSTTAEPDYRLLQVRATVDVNGNSASVTFSPAGLVTARFVHGKDGTGDAALPGTRMSYDLRAYAERGQPASVRSERRVHHDTDVDVPAAERDEVIVSVEFSDGFGRVVQTRSQAEDTLFGDPVFGGDVIPADLSPVAGTVGRTRAPSAPDNVVVGGWQVFDNKGRVVRRYEPFFGTGYEYGQPAEAQLGRSMVTFYDPRGHAVRTVDPDGSEQRVVLGVPADLTDPDTYAPTGWETYTYDADDNAGRTHPVEGQAYRDHWDTPAAVEVDALGRTVRTVAFTTAGDSAPGGRLATRSTYDIQGNLLSITDPAGRVAFRYSYDLARRRWRTDGIDGGRRDTVHDALGNPVETRDGKGALGLACFDVLNRPSRTWARDDRDGDVTMRQRVDYGDGGSADQPPAARATARAANLLGRPVRQYDEAGLLTTGSVDTKGNLLQTTRRVIADAPVLATYEQARKNGWDVPRFVVDWSPSPGQTQEQHDAELLEPTGYVNTTSYDGLDRVVRHLLPAAVDGHRPTMTMTYNRAGGLAQVDLDGTVQVERMAYDAKGHRVLIAYGNGIMTRQAYDPHTVRLVRMRSEPYSVSGPAGYFPKGPVLQDVGYDYDLVGNVLTIRDRTPGSGIVGNPQAGATDDPVLRALLSAGDALDRRFSYDPVYRLLTATGREQARPATTDPWIDLPRSADVTRAQPYEERYDHDPVGGLRRLAHVAAAGFTRDVAVGPGDNRISRLTVGATPYDYAHDPNGNVVTEAGVRHFRWNHADRLATFDTRTPGAEPSVHAHYLYDGSGRRVKKLVRRQGGAVEVTHYLNELFEHHRWTAPAAGENNQVHVLDDHRRIALVRLGPAHPDDRGPAVAVHLPDHLGSSTVVVDGFGAFVNREEYTPYGETSFGSYARKRFRFIGKERDSESGLCHLGARLLAPWLGRWLGADPSGAAGGLNQYAYAAGNPMHWIDPNGLQPATPQATGYGTVARYSAQASAVKEAGKRVTENEHIMPGAQLREVTRNPQTGVSDYTDAHYRNSTTLRGERITALEKTHGNRGGPTADNPRTAALKQRVQQGGSINYRDDVFEASRNGMNRARTATNSVTTEAQVNRALLAQDGELFAIQSLKDTGSAVARFERNAAGPASTVSRTVTAASKVGRAGRVVGAVAKAGGEVFFGISLVRHSFMIGTHLREGNGTAALLEGVGILEDLVPTPSPRPDHVSSPDLGPDQGVYKARIESSNRSGCQICHDAVRFDNMIKTTDAGRMWTLVNGPAVRNGFPTDAALRSFMNR